MKKIMVLALLLLAPLAQADVRLMLTGKYNPAPHSGGHGSMSPLLQTVGFKIGKDSSRIQFDTLLMTYDNSRKASFDALKGVYAGKCVSIFDTKVIAGVMIITEFEKEKKVIALVNEYGSEEYFYNSYDSYRISQDIQDFGKIVGPVVSEQPLVGTDDLNSGETFWHVGQAQGNLVAKMVYQGESGPRYLYGHKSVYINKGETYGACLYTEKLQ